MPLKLFLRGDVWHYRGTVAGRRLRGSTGVTKPNKETAQHVIADLEAKAWKGRLNGLESILTFARAANIYRAAGKSTRFLDRVEDYWKATPVKEISGGRIRASCRELYPKAKTATWNRAVIVPTQAIINYAAEQELCQKVFVKRWPVEKQERQPVSWEWVTTFSSSAPAPLAALVTFMFLTGARIGEAMSLRWKDVNLSRGSAFIRQTKTQSERSAHLPSELIAALANLPGDRHPDELVFGYRWRSTVKNHWDKTVAAAGVKRLTSHCCRHGFATGLLHAGVDPITVSKLGGWKNAAHVFATYGHASEDRTLTDVLTRQEHTPNPASTNALIKKRVSG